MLEFSYEQFVSILLGVATLFFTIGYKIGANRSTTKLTSTCDIKSQNIPKINFRDRQISQVGASKIELFYFGKKVINITCPFFEDSDKTCNITNNKCKKLSSFII